MQETGSGLAPSAKAWLDIHGHFSVPKTPAEEQTAMAAANSVKFIMKEPFVWDASTSLAYNNRANIGMQMLSFLPTNHTDLRAANDYGARLVSSHPTRFGLLAALPTDDAVACLEEIKRTTSFSIPPDGFAVSSSYNGRSLADEQLEPVWEALNRRVGDAVVFVHPTTVARPGGLGKLPTPLVEVAFETARTVVDMLYAKVFLRFPNIKFVLAHAGGALPALSGRLQLLGTESWIDNPHGLTKEDITQQLRSFYVDTAATARTGLPAAISMCGVERCIYGADCGVPCSTHETMEENRLDVLAIEKRLSIEENTIGQNGWKLFPAAMKRAGFVVHL